MILRAFGLALAQMADPRFRGVVLAGVGLSLALLVAVFVAFVAGLRWLLPSDITLPWIGTVGGIDVALTFGSAVLMLFASVFLMVPVASAFAGLFLERVADAVEARHYPALPPAAAVPFYDQARDTFNFLTLIVALNLLALLAYPFAGPLAPLLFWGLNGYLLGREYFTLVASRRLGMAGARALRRQNRGLIWMAGALMAAPLSVPLVNLFVPVLGAATFTHLVHALSGRGGAAGGVAGGGPAGGGPGAARGR